MKQKINILIIITIFIFLGFAKISASQIQKSELRSLPFFAGYIDADIEEGMYYIQSNSYDAFMVPNSSLNYGTYIYSNSFNSSSYMNINIAKTFDGYYSLEIFNTGWYIGEDAFLQGLNLMNVIVHSSINLYSKWRILKSSNSDEYLIASSRYNDRALGFSLNGAVRFRDNLSTCKWKLIKQETNINGEKFVQNQETRKYMDLYGPSFGNEIRIHQWDLNANNLSSISIWRIFLFTLENDGYYSIKNKYTNQYVGFNNSTFDVVQYEYPSTNTKWKIYSNNGYFKIEPYGFSPNVYSIKVDDGVGNGVKLVISNDQSSKNNWILHDATINYSGSLSYLDLDMNMVEYPQVLGFLPSTDIDFMGSYRNLKIFTELLTDYNDNTFETLFNYSVTHSIQAWDDYLYPYIRSVSIVNDNSDFDFYIQGGTREDLNISSNSVSGITYFTNVSLLGFRNYENEICKIWQINTLHLKIIDYPGNRIQYNINVTTSHELGHALGHVTHSPSGLTRLMNGSYSTSVPTTEEKNNVLQIYQLYY